MVVDHQAVGSRPISHPIRTRKKYNFVATACYDLWQRITINIFRFNVLPPWGQNVKSENVNGDALPEIITSGGYEVILLAGPNGVADRSRTHGLMVHNHPL